jgi:hypothetical protein
MHGPVGRRRVCDRACRRAHCVRVVMKANHLQRSGDIMSVSANRAWIGGPITDSGDPTQLGRGWGGRWPATAPDLARSFPTARPLSGAARCPRPSPAATTSQPLIHLRRPAGRPQHGGSSSTP